MLHPDSLHNVDPRLINPFPLIGDYTRGPKTRALQSGGGLSITGLQSRESRTAVEQHLDRNAYLMVAVPHALAQVAAVSGSWMQFFGVGSLKP